MMPKSSRPDFGGKSTKGAEVYLNDIKRNQNKKSTTKGVKKVIMTTKKREPEKKKTMKGKI